MIMLQGNLHDLCENMNRRHLAAQMAGRGSTGFHTVLYFKVRGEHQAWHQPCYKASGAYAHLDSCAKGFLGLCLVAVAF